MEDYLILEYNKNFHSANTQIKILRTLITLEAWERINDLIENGNHHDYMEELGIPRVLVEKLTEKNRDNIVNIVNSKNETFKRNFVWEINQQSQLHT